MKKKVALTLMLFSIVLTVGFLVYNQEVLANFLTKNAPIVSFDEYSQIVTKKERVDVIARETPNNKSKLWRQHLAYYGSKLELTKEQKAFLNKLSNFIDEDFFANADPDRSEFLMTDLGKGYEKLVRQIPELFTREQGRQLFTTVGDISVITDFGCGDSSTNKIAGVNSAAGCQCSVNSWCNFSCPEPKTDCAYFACTHSNGCGCLGIYICNGICVEGQNY